MSKSTRMSGLYLVLAGALGLAFFYMTDPRWGWLGRHSAGDDAIDRGLKGSLLFQGEQRPPAFALLIHSLLVHSLFTHALHYGTGAFEGIRAYKQTSGGGAVVGLVQQDAEVDQGIEVGGVSLKDLEVTLTGLIRAPQRRQQAGRFGEQVKIAVAGRQAALLRRVAAGRLLERLEMEPEVAWPLVLLMRV